MTLLPLESHDVEGLEGDEYLPYKVAPTCARPGCTKWTDHAHHLWSRGNMGGAYAYVKLSDGTVVGNLVPLCFAHHEDVTNNKVRITYEDGIFTWNGEAPLAYQPPKQLTVAVHTHPELTAHDHGEPEHDKQEKPICKSCGRALPRPKVEKPDEEKKLRRTWSVAVPYTEQENGAETIDALLGAARDEMDKAGLDWGEGHKVKFYVLSTALALFVQHGPRILSNE